jgi:hypothetical protein
MYAIWNTINSFQSLSHGIDCGYESGADPIACGGYFFVAGNMKIAA